MARSSRFPVTRASTHHFAFILVTCWLAWLQLGCGDTGDPVGAEAVRALFPAQAARVLDPGEALVATGKGFTRKETSDRPANGLMMVLPRRAEEPIRVRIAEGIEATVQEERGRGEGALAGATVVYEREDGTSFWTAGDGVYEEWIHLRKGAATAGAVIAAWTVDGAGVRETEGVVELLDAAGVPRARMTAPEAFAAGGRGVEAKLAVRGARVELSVDAGGEEVLVDPIWAPAALMTTARLYPTATLLGSGRVLVTGGNDAAGVALASAEIYDPVTNTWTPAAPMSVARYLHAATLLPNGKVLVTGGGTGGQANLNSAALYDPSTNTWTAAAPMSAGHARHTATLLPGGKVLIAGGGPGEIYTPASNTWAMTAPMITFRVQHTATLLSNGKVLVAGGFSGSSLASTELYDPGTNAWKPGAPMSAPRRMHAAVVVGAGRVLIEGGLGDATGSSYLTSAEVYDPPFNLWMPTGALTTARASHVATLLPDGNVLVTGGSSGQGALATVEIWNPATSTWAIAQSMISPRSNHTATLLTSGAVLVAGGNTSPAAELYAVALGNPCSAANECESGFCADGVCCNTACNAGAADACSIAAGAPANGTCVKDPDGDGLFGALDNCPGAYNPSQLDTNADGVGEACAPTCVTIFRGGLGAVEDTQISSDKADKNYGSSVSFLSGGVPPGLRQSLIRFDLGALGPSLQITSAKLNLVRTSLTGLATLRGHRVTSPWQESTVTWNSFAGSYDPAVLVSFLNNQPSYALDVTAAAQAWANNPAGNFGVLLEEDPGFVTSFRSSENPLPRPSLSVCYVVSECGPDGQACDDGDPCTTTSTCQAGVCVGGAPVTCGALDTCHVAGTCNPATGVCSNPPAPNGTVCGAGSVCTQAAACQSGACVAGGPVACPAADACHSAATCNPAADVWAPAAPMFIDRGGHAATLLPNGKVLVTGGWGKNGTLASEEQYDPVTNTWSPVAPMHHPRGYHTALLLKNGKVLVVGGFDDQAGHDVTMLESYDPATNAWTDLQPILASRGPAAVLANGSVLVVGALDYGGYSYLKLSQLYNPATFSVTTTGQQHLVRNSALTALGNGKALLTGGYNDNGDIGDSEVYNPTTNTWTITPGAYRDLPTATRLDDGTVLVTGGEVPGFPTGEERYDPATDTWSAAGSMITARAGHAAVRLGDGKVLVAGGTATNGSILSSAELYDPATGAWAAAGSMLAARSSPTLTLLPSGKVLAVGSNSDPASQLGAELYTPTCLTVVAPEGTACNDGDSTTSGDACHDGACTPSATCTDGLMNQAETDVDCDGQCAPCACPHSMCTFGPKLGFSCDPCISTICQVDPLCCHQLWDSICQNEVYLYCQQSCDECSNGVQDLGEVGVDCGGACPTPCGDLCVINNVVCPPALDACHDTLACNPYNGWCEGGSPKANGAPCDDGTPATLGDTCQSGVCTHNATCTDGIQNQGEAGVDCGGPCAACAASASIHVVAAGQFHSLARRADGTVWAVGWNQYGQLGDGTTISRSTPVQISGLSGVAAVSAGAYHSIVLESDGAVWAVGNNNVGQLGDGTTTERHTPAQVLGLSGITAVAAGGYHSIALRSDGTVWATGNNDHGQLGDGTTTDHFAPVQVLGLSGVTAVAAGERHSLALKSDGTVWAMGWNVNGQLGDGTTTDRLTPVQVSGLSGVTAVAAGNYHSLALKSDGTVWTVGLNAHGQLGDGTTTDRHAPVQSSGLSGATTVAAGLYHSLAVKSDGTVWATGYNGFNQLGDGTFTDRHSPVQVSGLSGVTAAAAGYFHSLSLKSDGAVWTVGYNNDGELGDGTTTPRSMPVLSLLP